MPSNPLCIWCRPPSPTDGDWWPAAQRTAQPFLRGPGSSAYSYAFQTDVHSFGQNGPGVSEQIPCGHRQQSKDWKNYPGKYGGGDQIRTGEWWICSPLPSHLATPPFQVTVHRRAIITPAPGQIKSRRSSPARPRTHPPRSCPPGGSRWWEPRTSGGGRDGLRP